MVNYHASFCGVARQAEEPLGRRS